MTRRRALFLSLVLASCSSEAPRSPSHDAPPADTGTLVQLVDTSIPPAIAGEGGWNYQQSAGADLTGDGEPERIILTARVELYRGQPAWDDGQPWQVYVEAPDGTRTYAYAQRLQLGTLTMRVTQAEPGRQAAVVLLEQLPDRMSVYEVAYAGPGRLTTTTRYQRPLDPRGEVAGPQLP